ncbi:MAG: GGDEF domain-containing protein [Acidobacteria bacterium]|nr:GGDEF domain-containing protein [Acidobacteriota bacterium]
MKRYVEETAILDLERLKRELQVERSRTPSLMIMAGNSMGRVVPLETFTELFMGRDADNDIVVDLAGLSRRHCLFYRRGQQAFVRDLESTNGTFVDGEPVSEAILREGSRVFLADNYVAKLTFTDESDLIVNRMLFEKATQDQLTGASNRTYFMDNFRREFAFHRRAGLPLSVIFFDLDNFKQINDEFGHVTGDTVLRHIAVLIRRHIREEDFFARYGGEEFILFLKNTAHDDACTKAEVLRRLLAETTAAVDEKSIPVTASFGVATFTDRESASAEELLIRADARMYDAKRAGKNCVCGRTETSP